MKKRTLRFGWFVAAITMLLVTSGCGEDPLGLDDTIGKAGVSIAKCMNSMGCPPGN